MAIRRHKGISRRELIGAAAASLAACSQDTAPAVQNRLGVTLPRPNNLNLIVIAADTWRCDHLGTYGATKAQTPMLDAFATDSTVFENCFADALPAIPSRRVWHAGRSLLHREDWSGPLPPDDVTLAEVLSRAGYQTGLITDTYPYFQPGMNLHRGFGSFQWIRGQETDPWIAGPMDEFDAAAQMPPYHWNDDYIRRMKQYMANTASRESEEDYFTALTVTAAMDWLERVRRQKPFFLWLDMFDPHEPWDAPPVFQQMYREDYGFDRYLFGDGVRNEDVRDTDYPILADLYAAEVSFSDQWIGRFLEKIDELGMRDDSIVVFVSDHGTHLGELGCIQKTPGLLNSTLARTPLIVRHPDRRFAGRRIPGLVSATDLMPTLLSLVGIREFPGLDGKSFWRLVNSPGAVNYERVFTGFGDFGAVHDTRWHFFQHLRGGDPGKGPALYDLQTDPEERRNVAGEHPGVVAERREWLAEKSRVTIPAL